MTTNLRHFLHLQCNYSLSLASKREIAIKMEEQRFLDIINHNQQIIYKVCYMYATDNDHFKDLYQEILINLWQGLERFRGDAQLSTWIYRICINTCVTYFRRNHRHDETLTLDAVKEVPDVASNRSEELKEMYILISRLRKLDKAIILMWLDEKSCDEIAEVTGLTRNNVASRLHRIKAKLVEYSQE